MKNAWIIVLFALAVAHNATAQTAADTVSFIKMTLKNIDDSPYANQKVVLRSKKGRVVEVKTDAKGFVRATVPFDDVYAVYCGDHRCRDSVKIQNFPYITYEYKGYSAQAFILNFTCKGNKGEPLSGEIITLEDEKGNKQEVTMDANGKAKAILGMQTYKIHANYMPYVHTVTGNPEFERHIINIPMNWVGTKEMKRRAFVADSLARAYYAELIHLYDSLAKDPAKLVDMDAEVPMSLDSTIIKTFVEAKAKGYKAKLASNPKYFEENKKTVLAVLNRIAPKISNAIVVTDVTGSMSPYMEQVLIWHALNFIDGKTTRYVFFNDGNHTPDDKKVIGKTGGLFFTQGTIKDFASIIGCLKRAANAGGGGDSEENDMEAVLAAHNKGTKGTEPIILVADNFSPVRDLELLAKVKVPVHVILCGLDAPKFLSSCPYAVDRTRVNAEYIEIARKTGGSVHTIGEDIMDLAKKKEGEQIKIDGTTYILKDGHFEAMER